LYLIGIFSLLSDMLCFIVVNINIRFKHSDTDMVSDIEYSA
jgi:hypothetical protein